MQKIVINTCHGGFSLSLLGQKEYLKSLNKEVYFYKQTKLVDEGSEKYYKVDVDNDQPFGSLFVCTFTKDLGNEVIKFIEEDYKHSFYFSDIERNDTNLIAVVEQLGEKANGDYSELKIVEIQDGIKWVIEEYDGLEWIAEEHRTWN